ncbi:hypothetical protein HW555_003306 [Spodoptera exigua]|uniref:Uncharacterized protein n=1 Tax=Spodoptera exigua TaxID=7107 RepID=A0A835L778_SPOEX|nr:hypothetical protein HW555_003306 [Spodoptera exigua]
MFQQLYMKICVIIILHVLHIAWSYRVHHLEANEVVPMLRRVLQGYEIPNYAEVRLRKSRHRFQPVGKSMFVKRIIPHGYKTGEYEYDSRLNTVFKPLFRYHVGTTSTEHEMSMVKGMKPVQKIPNTNSDLIVLTKIDHKGHLLPEITKYVQQKSKWKKTKKRFKSYLNNLNVKDKIKQLRFLERSGEMNDPFAPGNIPENYLPHQAKTTEPPSPKRIVPDYPFWNYWTYEKTISQDDCPGDLVKLGNMCVSPIGHRKQARRLGRHPKRKQYY